MAEQSEVAVEKPWLFKKGQSGNPAGRRPGGDDGQLGAMRWVLQHGEEKDRTPMQKTMRRALARDEMRFLARLDRLERAAAKARQPHTNEPPVERAGNAAAGPLSAADRGNGEIPIAPDEGVERARALIRRCLGVGDDERGGVAEADQVTGGDDGGEQGVGSVQMERDGTGKVLCSKEQGILGSPGTPR